MAKGFVHRLGGMTFRNSTRLGTARLMRLCAEAMHGWPTDSLSTWVRYSRGAPYSGTCYPAEGRIYVNLGRELTYPYHIGTHIAPAKTTAEGWCKAIYAVECADGYQLAVFIFLHECYHWLLRPRGRNERQKESMCDRFATHRMVERFGCMVINETGQPADRAVWDTQDVEGFVAAARTAEKPRLPNTPPMTHQPSGQLLLFGD